MYSQCGWHFPLFYQQVKYKADLKKLHKPVTDMSESLAMNHVLNTSHLASTVSHWDTFSLTFPCLSKIISANNLCNIFPPPWLFLGNHLVVISYLLPDDYPPCCLATLIPQVFRTFSITFKTEPLIMLNI